MQRCGSMNIVSSIMLVFGFWSLVFFDLLVLGLLLNATAKAQLKTR
jgi:hypothetical protein